jgi:hypothetical protein
MNQHTNKDLLEVLGPALKNKTEGKHLLEEYWADKICIIWTTEQVYRAANERGLALTKAEAIKVLQHLQFNYNPQYGIRWSDITDLIEERVLGTKLTKGQLHRFIHKDIITVQKP